MIAGSQARQLGCGKVMKGRQMRWVCVLVVLLGFAPQAFAADLDSDSDLDVLRGSEPVGPPSYTNWSGVYAGGQVSDSSLLADFSKATQPLVAQSLLELVLEDDDHPSDWPVLGKGSADVVGFGGFVGYNSQWQNLILGVEGNYSHSPVTVTGASSPILDRSVSAGGLSYLVNLLGTGSITLDDYVSLRARAGYILDNFLPYGFVGFVVGDGDYAVTSQIFGQQSTTTVPCTPSTTCVNYSFSNSAGKSNVLLYGFSVGGGLDWAVTQKFFLRGEFEMVQFVPVNDIVVSTLTGRLGVGVKF
jgi:outer membrane immunogenic protein